MYIIKFSILKNIQTASFSMPTIVFPDGQKREAVLTKTVAQVLQELCTNSDNQEYGEFF